MASVHNGNELTPGVGNSKKGLVGASGFEPPTSWSEAGARSKINNLAPLRTITSHYHKLLIFSQLRRKTRIRLTIHHRA